MTEVFRGTGEIVLVAMLIDHLTVLKEITETAKTTDIGHTSHTPHSQATLPVKVVLVAKRLKADRGIAHPRADRHDLHPLVTRAEELLGQVPVVLKEDSL